MRSAGRDERASRADLNGRDTLTAGLSALGFVNAAALLVWLVANRRLPAALTRPVAILWAAPWLVLVLAIHIGRRGYILPLVPLAVLVIAGYYARQRRSIGVALVSLQLVANVAQFAWLGPLPATTAGGAELHKNKSISARIASDLDAVTFPTAWTIAASDRRAAALSALVGDTLSGARSDHRRRGGLAARAVVFPAGVGHQPERGSGALRRARHELRWRPDRRRELRNALPSDLAVQGDNGRATALTPADARPAPGVGATTEPGVHQ